MYSGTAVIGCARHSQAFDMARLQQVGFLLGGGRPRTELSLAQAGSDERSYLVKKNSSADAKKKQKLAKYVPPTLVDYGNVTKITATPKSVSGPDNPGLIKKGGGCL